MSLSVLSSTRRPGSCQSGSCQPGSCQLRRGTKRRNSVVLPASVFRAVKARVADRTTQLTAENFASAIRTSMGASSGAAVHRFEYRSTTPMVYEYSYMVEYSFSITRVECERLCYNVMASGTIVSSLVRDSSVCSALPFDIHRSDTMGALFTVHNTVELFIGRVQRLLGDSIVGPIRFTTSSCSRTLDSFCLF